MPLYIKDPEVGRLAERPSGLRKLSKTEVVRQALLRELEREQSKPSLVEMGIAFCQTLKRKGDPALAASADKNFIDDLYEDK